MLKAARAEWAADLAEFHPATVWHAYRDCRTAFAKYPPNLAEFVELCRHVRRREDDLREFERQRRALPPARTPAQIAAARVGIAECRRLLGTPTE